MSGKDFADFDFDVDFAEARPNGKVSGEALYYHHAVQFGRKLDARMQQVVHLSPPQAARHDEKLRPAAKSDD